MTKESWWKSKPERKSFCLNIVNGSFQASDYKMEIQSHLCFCSICNWDSFAQTITASLSTLQRIVSTVLYSQQ